LFVLTLRTRDNASGAIEDDETSAGRALIDCS
jgi:hypothetical protein